MKIQRVRNQDGPCLGGDTRLQTMDEIETLIRPERKSCEEKWRDFFKLNCNALFQTAMLLTADKLAAEVALLGSIDALAMSSPPGQHSLAAWHRVVALRSIETSPLSSSAVDPATRFMLHPGLLPVIEIERSQRICFVLRMLLGYTTAVCAEMLGVEESGVRMLFQMAVLQLQQKVVANSSTLNAC